MRTYGNLSVAERVELLPDALKKDDTVRNALTAFFILMDRDDETLADAFGIRQRLAAEDFVETGVSPELEAMLARDMAVTWFDEADVFPDEAQNEQYRRTLLKTAKKTWRAAGTAGAMETVLRALMPNMRVSEWYEYGGEPYHFRISTGQGPDDAPISVEYISRMIGVYKRASAVLDGLSTDLFDRVTVRFAEPLRAGTIDYRAPGGDALAGEAIPGADFTEANTQ